MQCPYLLRQLTSASTRNEYFIKRYLAGLFGLLAVNGVISWLGIDLTSYPRISWIAYLTETTIVILCSYYIWCYSKHQVSPLIKPNTPFLEGAFQSGPLTRAVRNLVVRVYNAFTEKKPAPVKSSPPQQQPQQQPATATATGASTATNNQTATPARPTFMFQSKPWRGPIADSPAEAARGVFESNDSGPVGEDMRNLAYVPVPERLGDPSLSINLPKLESRPCHAERKKTSERLNKLLWRLNPQPNIIERFRQEQEDDMLENWDRFDDRSSKVYYDRLRQWLTKNIMDPTLHTVSLVEKQLPQQGTNFVDCPPNILALLMIEPTTMADNTFPITLVQKMISIKGYENDRARKYVLDRLKEFVKRSRYHSITKEPELPTDSEIILHLFNTYLGFAMPNVVPPLVPLQGGDVYKFLLVYFYTTEDLEKEIFQ